MKQAARIATIGVGTISLAVSAIGVMTRHSHLETTSLDSPTPAIYTLQDISKHNCEKQGYWVAYKNNVYNITEFVNKHAGMYRYLNY